MFTISYHSIENSNQELLKEILTVALPFIDLRIGTHVQHMLRNQLLASVKRKCATARLLTKRCNLQCDTKKQQVRYNSQTPILRSTVNVSIYLTQKGRN